MHFERTITQADIIETYSGVRPLCDDESDQPSAVTRDYTLAMTMLNETVPLLSVFGGKLTTYRKLAESALDELNVFSLSYRLRGLNMSHYQEGSILV
jgi:glycerol-3-phosphate dehydrogenase